MNIKGVGMTVFGHDPRPSQVMVHDAATQALADAEMNIKDIDAIVVASQPWFFGERQRHFSSLLASVFKTNVPIVQVPAACGGGGAALWHATKLGYENALVVGVEKLMQGSTEKQTDEFMMATEPRYEQAEGVNFPAQNALVAQAYLGKYPETTMQHLAKIAKKNHDNAVLNPKARFYQKPVSMDAITASPIIATPLRLYDCSISVDGAAAAVITKDQADISIAGIDLRTDVMPVFEKKDLTSWTANKLSATNAFEMADMTPKDIHIAELHDAFTPYELIAYEDLGFAEKGQAYRLIDQDYFTREGKLPVNISGGLKARGHPLSATGLAQIYELAMHLRSQAGERQIEGVKNALAHNVGGSGGTVTTTILKRT